MHLHSIRRRLTLLGAAMLTVMSTQSFAQSLPAGALPTGWNVTSGNASIVQNGTTLNINQTTPQALVNFSTFNVGSGALVDIRQLNSSSALLARTTGGDSSQIYGQIRANGALWLINPAGIMVGAGARIDVGSFIASTLNVKDSDFLAGRLAFKADGTPGELRNAGAIKAASGGSIYLLGPSVINTGTLNAPEGEVLLAAGQTVQLLDTGTPGVSVAITGVEGEVRNLGRITAEAGRIGLAAGLVSNSGSINASSVVREGGRIFLRASGDLKTSVDSDISANGTSGGRVVLYADGAASIDGQVSATGSAGRGGYVDTSGQRSLEVVNAPVVGQGGEWYIDPYNIEVVASGPDAGAGVGDGGGGIAVVSTGSGAKISAETIVTQLNAGVNVSITTGAGGAEPGNITVSAAINKTGALDSALTLNANNSITINAPITSTASKLDLNLNSNQQDSRAVQINANPGLNGGALKVSHGTGGNVPPAPSLSVCVAAPATAGCAAVLPTLSSCVANPATPGCSAVLPTLSSCVANPAATGCSAVLPTLSSCVANPATPGCSAVLPALSSCVANPATPGCSAVLPTLSSCIANPAATGCSAVLPTLSSCVANPATPGCSVVLPRLSSCIANPAAPGCSAVLPTLSSCVANPTAAGCSAVLPPLSLCVAIPAASGCSVVLPALSLCVANPAATGCSVVLPPLSSCIATPATAGCSVVLPTLMTCAVSSALPGCLTVMQAFAGNETFSSTVSASTSVVISQVNATGQGSGAIASPPTSPPPSQTTNTAARNEPVKKLYCN